jgi:cobalamin biosynthesis protein CobT
MSNDLVNQLTLNFLISKTQLQKLNKKVKETSDQERLREIQQYNERIKNLFNDLLVCQAPDDLLFEVKNTFDNFIDKAIYYFKAHDNNNELEMERNSSDIQDDIDYDRESREIEKGNYLEEGQEEEGQEEEGQEEELEEEGQEEELEEEGQEEELEEEGQEEELEESEESSKPIHNPVIVKSKYSTTNSVGVNDIQKLPFNWFENVHQNYKKNQIIPRKKDPIIVDTHFSDVKKKI